MTQYVGRVWTALSSAFEFNSATLSGAIDVIVIEDEKGRRQSSPFHVRFGKLQLLRTRGLPVTVELNSRPTNIRMYLGPAGEAYFYHPPERDASTPGPSGLVGKNPDFVTSSSSLYGSAQGSLGADYGGSSMAALDVSGLTATDDTPVRSDLRTLVRAESLPPLPLSATFDNFGSSRSRPVDDAAAYASDSEVEISKLERDGAAEVPLEPRSPPVSGADRRYVIQFPRSRKLREKQSGNSSCRSAAGVGSPSDTGAGRAVTLEVRSEKLEAAVAVEDDESAKAVVVDRVLEDVAVGEAVSRDAQEAEKASTDSVSVENGVTDGVKESPVSHIETSDSEFHTDDASQQARGSLGDPGAEDPPAGSPVSLHREPSVGKEGPSAPVADADACLRNGTGPTEHAASDGTLHVHIDSGIPVPVDSVVVSADAETETIVAEESKLEVRSLDGYDDEDDETADRIALDQDRLIVDPERLSNSLTRVLSTAAGSEDGNVASLDASGRSLPPRVPDGGGADDPQVHVDLSLCGSTVTPGMPEEDIRRLFETHAVSEDEFRKNPSIVLDPNMMFSIEDRLVDFRVAVPYVMFKLSHGKALDLDELYAKMAPGSVTAIAEGSRSAGNGSAQESVQDKKPQAKSGGITGWFPWSRSTPKVVGEPLLSEEDWTEAGGDTAKASEDGANGEGTKEAKAGDEEVSRDASRAALDDAKAKNATDAAASTVDGSGTSPVDSTEILTMPAAEAFAGTSGDAVKPAADVLTPPLPEPESPWCAMDARVLELMDDMFDGTHEELSRVPSPEQLAELDLQPGANTIRFVVESSLAEVNCRVFLWNSDAKIVISDVDGTITRSDVLGHILPVVGRDWSHVGVAQLYSEIAKHGYKFVYLTARPIGQASQTRNFLRSVVQSGARLPNGPVLMSPNRLVESFTREVIHRRPQEFKIGCLRDVRSLFPMDYNPFHAGFGNRETDVISYRAVSMLPHRIFVVDTSSEIAVNSVRYESASSYSSLIALVTSVFPDISGRVGHDVVHGVTDSAMYNSWMYWRTPHADVDLDALLADDQL